MNKTFRSNLAKAWSAERQDALFKRNVPGWPKVSQYCDEPSAAKRKALDVTAFTQRGDMLRATRRGDVIYVASLPCLAMHEADLASILLAIGERGGNVHVLDSALVIPAGAMTTQAAAAIRVFRGSKRRAQTEPGRRAAAKAAGERREAESREKAEPFRDRWNRRDDKTPALLAEMGLTYNTAIKILDPRPKAQAAFERGQAQAERNRNRRRSSV